MPMKLDLNVKGKANESEGHKQQQCHHLIYKSRTPFNASANPATSLKPYNGK